MRSKPFGWIGANGNPRADIEFPSGPHIIVPEGEKREVDIIVRKPQARHLRLVDDLGEPVSGVKVTSSIYGTDGNHCGVLFADFLDENTSDANGRVRIPDGDFEYAFVFDKPLYILKHTSSVDPQRLITYLTAKETTIELHRLQSTPLEIFVTQDGKPAAGRALYADSWNCPCGMCFEPIAKTDEAGRIYLAEFYPEMWSWLYFRDEEGQDIGDDRVVITDENGNRIFSSASQKWSQAGVIHVDIKP